ncbi:beta galactosidase jelly roll domain-containing protein [Sphingobacterium bambusae]|uniref:Beta galactosidase jelly roll domain-containing protein n=2 Tax=Sphingobacterium bambusae TaxID=662858 RepID=A0ABW6B8S0_9SPHI|nr:beta galactosidase jelly roll domain-containing protein [Sphingobacterium bambusae]WPL49180.1 beta galactosidase jelly roll domain-containing protein [Sphingobacterium bambusae]
MLLPMNELGLEAGYACYETLLNTTSRQATLELEHVRDYAVVYVDGHLQGSLDDSRKKIVLSGMSGKHHLQLFVENIGRITYGPEILDNSKGLFGWVKLDGEHVEDWTMKTLDIKNYHVEDLSFSKDSTLHAPCFYQGVFSTDASSSPIYLDISGWGMGEVWINGHYLGSFWEQEKQQSLLIPSNYLIPGTNTLVVFEMHDKAQQIMKLTDKPVFK